MGRAFVLPWVKYRRRRTTYFMLRIPPSVACNCLGKEVNNARKHHGSHRGLTGAPTIEWLDEDAFDDIPFQREEKHAEAKRQTAITVLPGEGKG